MKAILLLASLTAVVAHLYGGALFTVRAAAKAEMNSLATSAFYEAATEVLSEKYLEEIVKTERSEGGAPTCISTNALKADLAAKLTAEKTFAIFSEKLSEGVSLNAGVFTGIGLLAGYGKKIKVKLLSVTSVTCEFVSESETIGINQTSRRYYLVCHPEYVFAAPCFTEGGTLEVKMLLYDYHIVGEVPQFFVSLGK